MGTCVFWLDKHGLRKVASLMCESDLFFNSLDGL